MTKYISTLPIAVIVKENVLQKKKTKKKLWVKVNRNKIYVRRVRRKRLMMQLLFLFSFFYQTLNLNKFVNIIHRKMDFLSETFLFWMCILYINHRIWNYVEKTHNRWKCNINSSVGRQEKRQSVWVPSVSLLIVFTLENRWIYFYRGKHQLWQRNDFVLLDFPVSTQVYIPFIFKSMRMTRTLSWVCNT